MGGGSSSWNRGIVNNIPSAGDQRENVTFPRKRDAESRGGGREARKFPLIGLEKFAKRIKFYCSERNTRPFHGTE